MDLNNKPNLLFFDTETGGIGLNYSLLTAYFIVTDKEYNVIDTLELNLKPDDGNYVICGEAMRVNKIDIASLDEYAITYKEAGTKLYQFLKKNADGGKIKLIPCGHGIRGDIEQVTDKLISKGSWEVFCSYRVFDTCIFAQGLKIAGLFPESVSGSLSSLADYFGVKYELAKLHTSEEDTQVTVQVMKNLLEIVQVGDQDQEDREF